MYTLWRTKICHHKINGATHDKNLSLIPCQWKKQDLETSCIKLSWHRPIFLFSQFKDKRTTQSNNAACPLCYVLDVRLCNSTNLVEVLIIPCIKLWRTSYQSSEGWGLVIPSMRKSRSTKCHITIPSTICSSLLPLFLSSNRLI